MELVASLFLSLQAVCQPSVLQEVWPGIYARLMMSYFVDGDTIGVVLKREQGEPPPAEGVSTIIKWLRDLRHPGTYQRKSLRQVDGNVVSRYAVQP